MNKCQIINLFWFKGGKFKIAQSKARTPVNVYKILKMPNTGRIFKIIFEPC